MALKFYFFSSDGIEMDTEMNGIDAGSCGPTVEYKGHNVDKFGRAFRRNVTGYVGSIVKGKRVDLSTESFGGRPVLVKHWAPVGHTMATEFFWLVP